MIKPKLPKKSLTYIEKVDYKPSSTNNSSKARVILQHTSARVKVQDFICPIVKVFEMKSVGC